MVAIKDIIVRLLVNDVELIKKVIKTFSSISCNFDVEKYIKHHHKQDASNQDVQNSLEQLSKFQGTFMDYLISPLSQGGVGQKVFMSKCYDKYHAKSNDKLNFDDLLKTIVSDKDCVVSSSEETTDCSVTTLCGEEQCVDAQYM